ncbi:MAG: RnfABCDGE type electron transport complex subunit C, partial [Candidatus Omnitrophica bacterium]|nr:RnfABCDGE type electron transport complex subunit C [Candidatus Omnitrophota bacterium]
MVRLKEHKIETSNKHIELAHPPLKAYIPLSQHIGKICSPLVQPGDTVLRGQKIAAAENGVYVPVHASISGKVIAIEECPHPILGRCKAIIIENDGKDSSNIPPPKTHADTVQLTPDQIRSCVFEAGIVGMGGASFPTYLKLTPPKPVHTLIINGAECEPYLTGDYRLMKEKTGEILAGIELISSCLGVKTIYIAIEDNKPDAIEQFKIYASSLEWARERGLSIKTLKSNYPQGGEKQLIKNITKKEVPQQKLPYDIGVVVVNVATVFAVFEAVYKNKPLYERVVTVTGGCFSNPQNILVRIGTPIKE